MILCWCVISRNPYFLKKYSKIQIIHLHHILGYNVFLEMPHNPDHASTPKPKKTYSAAQFKKMDKNQDGFITLKEFIGNPEGRNVPALKKQFSRRDGNGDAKLTLMELNN